MGAFVVDPINLLCHEAYEARDSAALPLYRRALCLVPTLGAHRFLSKEGMAPMGKDEVARFTDFAVDKTGTKL